MNLKKLVGDWEGNCRTWFQPGELADESSVRGSFEPVLDGRFLRHVYSGEIQETPRVGEELIAFNSVAKRFQTSWVDSFHMNYGILFSEGQATDFGFSVEGKYDIGENDPAWGWRTEFALHDEGQLTIRAYNVTPNGEEALAIETQYRRLG